MNKIRRWMKKELHVEMMACVHAFVMIFTYLLGRYVLGKDGILFWQVVEMGILAYVSAWIQELVFRRPKVYTVREYWMKALLWCGVPSIMTLAAGGVFGWMEGLHWGMSVYFYGMMICYYALFFFCEQHFLREDSEELNQLLEDYKKR